MDPRNPIDVNAQRIVAWINAQVLEAAAQIDPELPDLVAVALWDALETQVTEAHRSYVRSVKATGRTWDDIAVSLGLSRGSSAESRYTLSVRNRNRTTSDGKRAGTYPGRPPESALKRAELRERPPSWLPRPQT